MYSCDCVLLCQTFRWTKWSLLTSVWMYSLHSWRWNVDWECYPSELQLFEMTYPYGWFFSSLQELFLLMVVVQVLIVGNPLLASTQKHSWYMQRHYHIDEGHCTSLLWWSNSFILIFCLVLLPMVVVVEITVVRKLQDTIYLLSSGEEYLRSLSLWLFVFCPGTIAIGGGGWSPRRWKPPWSLVPSAQEHSGYV